MSDSSPDSAAPVPRRTYPKGDAKRAEILAAALDTIAQQGSQRAYIRAVAERVGLTSAGLLHHFRSREQLFQEVLRSRDVHDHDEHAESPVGIEGFLAVIEHNQTVPGLVQLYAEYAAEAAADPCHPARDFFQSRYASLVDALAADVAIAQEQGQMGPNVDGRTLAMLMINAADGLQVQWLLDPHVDMVGHLRELWRMACVASFAERDDARG